MYENVGLLLKTYLKITYENKTFQFQFCLLLEIKEITKKMTFMCYIYTATKATSTQKNEELLSLCSAV